MIRFAIRTVIDLASSALALLVASWLVPGVNLAVRGFVVAVVVFVLASALLTPFAANMARKYAPAALGGIGIIATLLALWLATIFGGLTITGAVDWALATLIVWLVTSLGAWALFAVWGKKKLQDRDDARADARRAKRKR